MAFSKYYLAFLAFLGLTTPYLLQLLFYVTHILH